MDLIESGNTYLKLFILSGGSAKIVPSVHVTKATDFDFALDRLRILPETASFEFHLSGVETVETFDISYRFYESEQYAQQPSGAYIFRPKDG